MRTLILLGFKTPKKDELGQSLYLGRDSDELKEVLDASDLYRFEVHQLDLPRYKRTKDENYEPSIDVEGSQESSGESPSGDDIKEDEESEGSEEGTDEEGTDEVASEEVEEVEEEAPKRSRSRKSPAKKATKRASRRKKADEDLLS